MKTAILRITGLDCANCAARLERKLAKIEGIQEVNLTFATQQLRITAENPMDLLSKIQEVAKKFEPNVNITTESKDAIDLCVDRANDHKECGCNHEHHHHHHDECGCDHGHHHHGECGCGHEHHHHHDECGCDHEHHHHGECGCDHEHHHEDLQNHEHKSFVSDKNTLLFRVEGLDCANCAAKLERKIAKLPNVEDAILTFSTSQLRVKARHSKNLLEQMQQLAATVEPGVVITPITKTAPQKQEEDDQKADLIKLIIGAVLFVAGAIMHHQIGGYWSLIALIPAYLLLGIDVLKSAVKCIAHKNMLDENFLMSIATIGAFAVGEYPEAVGVMLFFMIGEYFEHRAVAGSRKAIMEAIDMRPETVILLTKDGEQTEIPAEEAMVGDILLVRPGDRIPLDGNVYQGESHVDTSPVTGEPVPVHVVAGDAVISGCVNGDGLLQLQVEKPLSESMVTRILDAVENAAAGKPQMERFITRFSQVYTPFVVIVAALTAVLPPLFSGDWNYWVHTALTFLVISCPCALVLSVPLAYYSGIGKGSRSGILFKSGASLEALNKVKAVVLDKTGTITKGDFKVQQINGENPDQVLALCAACEQNSTHPLAQSIVKEAAVRNLTLPQVDQVSEISGHGVTAVWNGQPIVCGNEKLMRKMGVAVNTTHGDEHTHVYVACNGAYIGAISVGDTIKNTAQQALADLNKKGIKTAILTGDHIGSAEAVGKKVNADRVYADLLPEDKLRICKQLRTEWGNVMFVGDGINDAPVLAGVDVGCAMGSGADAAIEAADAVFMKNDLNAIGKSIDISRLVSKIAIENVVFALVIKALVMVLGLLGFANMWLAVFADSGVAMLCVLNSVRVLMGKNYE